MDIDDVIDYLPDEGISNPVAKQISAFQCLKCEFVHSSYSAIEDHQKVHNADVNDGWEEETILLCSLCYGQFSTVDTLRDHMIDVHNLKPINNGKDPDPEFDVEKEKVEELEAQNVDNGFDEEFEEPIIHPVPFKEFKLILKSNFMHKCSFAGCHFKFESLDKLDTHTKCHKSSETAELREFICVECGNNDHNWRACSIHLWKKHQIEIDLLTCPLCSFKAMTSVNIWHHMKTHKRWKSKVLKSMKKNKNKESTANIPPPPPKNKYYTEKTCEICHRKFVNGKTLSKHVKDVHNKIKPFICNVCGWKSSRKYSLKIHMRQHTGEKPLACNDCEFTTRDPSVLSKHKKRHEKSVALNCNHCSYTCVQTSNLKQHIKKKHPEEFTKISCDLCSYVSISADRLFAHKRDHQNGLILNNEDSLDASREHAFKNPRSFHMRDKRIGNMEISSDCFLPLESTDSIAHDPPLDTGGVTIPAHSEDTQFATYLNM